MATDVCAPANAYAQFKPPAAETVVENRIFIGGIPAHADDNEVKNFLLDVFDKKCVRDVKIISDRTGTSKGYGFVTFETKEVAQKILASSEFENVVFKDRKLNISKAVKKLSPPKSSYSQAAVLPNSAPVQYVLYSGQDGLGYPQQLVTVPHYGYGQLPLCLAGSHSPYSMPNPTPAAGAKSCPGSATTLMSSAQQPAQWPALQWPSPLANQQLPYLSPAVGLPYFGHSRSTDLLYYPAAYNTSITSDYSSCSDPSSLEADADCSPVRGNPADCYSPAMLPYSPQPLLAYAPTAKGHQQQMLPRLQGNGVGRHDARNGAKFGDHGQS